MVIDGRQFYAGEIQSVLAMAANDAMNEYNDSEDPAWLAAYVSLVSTKVKVNELAMEDTRAINMGGLQKTIRKGDSLWAEIDAVLVPVADYDDVSYAVSQLSQDVGELAAGASWTRPLLVAGIVGALAFVGYQWARK